MLTNKSHNPDVLTCLANLSSDEVFTPPDIANQMLDLLPSDIWSDSKARFLDPACKSGVFLREIAKRLDKGLETQIPERQDRIRHILKNQLYGLAITELTAMLSRRSLYCSKHANGKYSVCDLFEDEQGNIRFERVKHKWKSKQCIYCGASQTGYDRGQALETHAYEFIHTPKPQEIFNMQFDVIVGNPPYQLGSDGGTRDIPVYNRFVEQAIKLNPRYLTMIIPSRWMASGLGLSDFRRSILSDRRLRQLVDFPVSSDVFPGVEVKGGVCYFLWVRDGDGKCLVTTIRGKTCFGPVERNLDEYDIFVRDSRALSILQKVLSNEFKSIISILSVDKEFGWTSNFDDFCASRAPDSIPLHYIRSGKRLTGYISRDKIIKSKHLVDKWKLLVPQAGSDGGKKLPDSVLGKPLIATSPSVCTQSYLFFYVDNEDEAISINSYIRTRFVRFMVSLRKITQHATRSTYTWVPIQQWNQHWNDHDLYEMYNLTANEITYIETMIRAMEPLAD